MEKCIEFEIKRCEGPEKEPYYKTYSYTVQSSDDTVATALRSINIAIESGEYGNDTPVVWDYGCLQKKCGACAMVINNHPALACSVKLSACKSKVKLEPMSKFPVIKDLVVDRKAIFDALKALKIWKSKEVPTSDEKSMEARFEASRCLECGLCLEVCPAYAPGMEFKGTAVMVPMAGIIEDEKDPDVMKSYEAGFYEGCAKSFACVNICPARIESDMLMARSNHFAVWKRK